MNHLQFRILKCNTLTKRFKQVHKKLLTLSFTEYFVLQCWRNGGNRCRYVHPARWEAYEEACEGYRRFMALAEAYADIVTAAVEAGSTYAKGQGLLTGTTVIAAPHEELWRYL